MAQGTSARNEECTRRRVFAGMKWSDGGRSEGLSQLLTASLARFPTATRQMQAIF